MNALRVLKGIYFWIMATSVTGLLFLVCCFRRLAVVLCNKSRHGDEIHEIASLWGRTLMQLTPGWRITIEGKEHLPPHNTPYLIVANHESMSDIFAMYFLGIQFRWLAKDSVFKIPLIGKAMTWAAYVPVKRGDKDSASQAMRESADRLAMNIPMFFFPEGTRSKDGSIKPFKLGAFRLARDAQVCIVPVAIHGAADLMPKGSGLPGCSHVRVKVLPTLPPPAKGSDERLMAYAEDVRQRIIAAHRSIVGSTEESEFEHSSLQASL